MRTAMKLVWWGAILLVVLPIAVQSALAYARGWPSSWNRADWSETRTFPDARKHKGALIAVMAARSGRWKSIFAAHHWIVIKPESGRYERYDVVGWGTPLRRDNWPAAARWYSNDPQIVFRLDGPDAQRNIAKLRRTIRNYPWKNRGTYRVWPGPNSNTFVAWVLRHMPELKAEMLPEGIGKDYLGPGLQLSRMPSGAGWQASWSGLVGAGVGWREGLEFHLLGATIGIDPGDLAIKLPGIGKLGLL